MLVSVSPEVDMSANELILTEADGGKEVSVPAGGTIIVRLPANPSTGYSWHFITGFDDSFVRLVRHAYTRDPAPEGVVGSGGTAEITFTAGESGKGWLRFIYLRPWERDVDAESIWQVLVSIA
jgi:inhibitor of cysteine peptidase